MPEHCKTTRLGRRIGEMMGKVMDVEIFSMRSKEEKILKIQVLMDITKSLKRKLKISGSNSKVTDLHLKYERIGNFCYCCGSIGHEVRACNTHLEQIAKGEAKEEEWGVWLRADQFGWRLENQKENKNSNCPNIVREGEKKQRKPTPVSLIKSFASLSV
ncbi:hypothetical protein Ahy_B04g070226 [Arachis hypogaea]|uniref:CCHC-type domain-containing protein n=1 Tax=Arachis hypogaea TaxID=3818 RepID=A0A444ZFL1_ARAHY|nr:hypothetical protein Ahy_B04g070226 [Arachis hypogaea]